MMKKFIYSSSIVVFISFSVFMFYLHQESKKSEQKLESLMGNAVFNVWESLNEINENKAVFTIENIEQINAKMIKTMIYAEIVDKSVGEELLAPIIQNIATIGNNIESDYRQNKQLTNENKKKYEQYATEVEKTITAIYDVYYIPNSEGQTKLNIENFEELININHRLEQIKAS